MHSYKEDERQILFIVASMVLFKNLKYEVNVFVMCRMGNFEGVKNWFLVSCYSLVVRMGFS